MSVFTAVNQSIKSIHQIQRSIDQSINQIIPSNQSISRSINQRSINEINQSGLN